MGMIEQCAYLVLLGEEARRLRDEPEPVCNFCFPDNPCVWHRTRKDWEREQDARP